MVNSHYYHGYLSATYNTYPEVHGMRCLLWVLRLNYIIALPLSCCMQYSHTLTSIMTQVDFIMTLSDGFTECLRCNAILTEKNEMETLIFLSESYNHNWLVSLKVFTALWWMKRIIWWTGDRSFLKFWISNQHKATTKAIGQIQKSLSSV